MIEEGLVERLETDTALIALCGDRIYDAPAPEGAVRPHITYELAGEDRDRHLQGPSGLVRGTFQVRSWAQSKDAARIVAERVRLRLDNFAGVLGGHEVQRMKMTNRQSSWDFQAEGTENLAPHILMTFDVWYAEELPPGA